MKLGFLLVALWGCGQATPAEPALPDASLDGGGPATAWQVADGHLRAPDGRVAILRGVNLANVHKKAPYLGMESADDWLRLRRDFGFNAVRFLMTWAAVEPEQGRYDDAYLDRVRERLGWAHDAGLHVVLDMHQDVYGEGFGFDGAPRWTCDEAHYAAFEPVEPWFLNNVDPDVVACVDHFYQDADTSARFVAAWSHVVARLADVPSVVGFDVLNEPTWGSHAIPTYERELLMPLYERVVTAVRREAPEWVAFLEPGASRNAGAPTSLSEFAFEHVVYAPHSYDTAAESGQGFDSARREAILDNVRKLRDEAEKLGAALWVGEYGGSAAAPGIAAYMDAQYDAFAAVAAGSMYWSYDRDASYGLLNPDGSEKAELVGVLVRPYPELVAGTPRSWAWDEESSTFSFTYEPDAALALPTDIVVPARSYPRGYSVECGGCETEQLDGLLRLRPTPRGESTTVTLRPR
jgi:endoglycosylceramidase